MGDEEQGDEGSIAGDSVAGDVVKGGGAGAAVGGPWGALIGAAGGLILGLMNNKAQQQRQAYDTQAQEHARQQNALMSAQNTQVNNVGNMGARENNAIQNLIGVFGRAR